MCSDSSYGAEEASASDQLAEFLAEAMNSLGEFESQTMHLWGELPPGELTEVDRLQMGTIRFTDISVCVTQFVDQSVQLSFVVDDPNDPERAIAHISWVYTFSNGDSTRLVGEGAPTLSFGIGGGDDAEAVILANEGLHRVIHEVNDYSDNRLMEGIRHCIDVSEGSITAREGATITTTLTLESLRRFYFSLMTCIASAS